MDSMLKLAKSAIWIIMLAFVFTSVIAAEVPPDPSSVPPQSQGQPPEIITGNFTLPENPDDAPVEVIFDAPAASPNVSGEVNGSGEIWVLLLIILFIAVIFIFWMKKRKKKISDNAGKEQKQ